MVDQRGEEVFIRVNKKLFHKHFSTVGFDYIFTSIRSLFFNTLLILASILFWKNACGHFFPLCSRNTICLWKWIRNPMNFWKLMDNIHDIIRMKYCQKTNNEYFPILIQFRSKHSSHWATINKLSHFKSTR